MGENPKVGKELWLNKVSTQIIELDLTGIKDMSPYIYTYSSEDGTSQYIQ